MKLGRRGTGFTGRIDSTDADELGDDEALMGGSIPILKADDVLVRLSKVRAEGKGVYLDCQELAVFRVAAT
jgi:hypothetical protein